MDDDELATEGDPRWVTVFGFPPSLSSRVLEKFSNFGAIIQHKMSAGTNWMHICYTTPGEAEVALNKDGRLLTRVLKVGVERAPTGVARHEDGGGDSQQSSITSSLFEEAVDEHMGGGNADPLPPDMCWVTVFGFPTSCASQVLEQFSWFGDIVRHKMGEETNWMHIHFEDSLQAKRALSKDGRLLTSKLKIGVETCMPIVKRVLREQDDEVLDAGVEFEEFSDGSSAEEEEEVPRKRGKKAARTLPMRHLVMLLKGSIDDNDDKKDEEYDDEEEEVEEVLFRATDDVQDYDHEEEVGDIHVNYSDSDYEEPARKKRKRKKKGAGGGLRKASRKKKQKKQFVNLQITDADRDGDNYICRVCQKSFSFRSRLEQHFRVHTGERPYNCDQCSKSFSQVSTLNVHKRTHYGHPCQVCGKTYSLASLLVEHKKKKHRIV